MLQATGDAVFQVAADASSSGKPTFQVISEVLAAVQTDRPTPAFDAPAPSSGTQRVQAAAAAAAAQVPMQDLRLGI